MNYSVDDSKNIPAYLQIYQQIRQDIIDGYYPYGAKIPSKRTLASESGVSVITIKHVMDLLNEEGYIESRQRSGYYVIFTKDDFWGASGEASEAAVSMQMVTSQNLEAFPYTVYAKTVRKVILDHENQLFIKSPSYGLDELRAEICLYLARSRSIHVKPEQVIVGSGAEYLYGLIAQMFGGLKFAIEDPSYSKIQKVYESLNIKLDHLKLNSDGIDSRQLIKTDAQVLHTTPFNSYPSGISINSSKKHEYIRWANKREGIIIEDNYESELTISSKPEDSLFSMAGGKNVIYLNTFSRTIAPSVRIGYMILPEDLIETFNSRLGFYSCTVPVLDQYVITELLRSGDFERHINRIRRKRRKELSGNE